MPDHITFGVADLERCGAFVLDPEGRDIEAVRRRPA